MAATTLPACYSTDPDLFREEVERFYCQDWICAGRANRIPELGDYWCARLLVSIIITRDRNDLVAGVLQEVVR